ncbi:glycosyltransferase [Streptantibioticus rubrisoli]|uniref:Glycosyltransferase family 4 protein n=1 Tax=Streptantibioticus rubrisoli TaxID=1387313 RepID=A0ABT1PBI8_9ACTN|nr:glycosyltransferase family 4 protein [Streptantibioticus rubrisoli]MCQ4042737.1 glycosyltransferase family 4 protein [Streptantibioticus rubrisoli]
MSQPTAVAEPRTRTLTDAFPGVTEWQGRHVVLCNWRDGSHPQAGGAELYCEEVAAELHRAGVRVTYLTARPPGAARRERTRYGTVVRGGGRFTVYPFVLLWLLFHRARVDGVIDSQNGIPFFTPLALRRRTPVVLLIHHVHQDQFGAWFPRPLAALGRWLENRGSRLVYGRRAVSAVSPSSRAEIRARLSLPGPVYLAPCGQPAPDPAPQPRALCRDRAPRVVCVGRLVRQKRVDRLLRAVPALQRELPGVRLHLVGDGEARPELETLAARLGVTDAVVFHGRVSRRKRDELVASAWITATASTSEGWGLSVMEAAAAGVPAVAYAVPGLRDTVRPSVTGWLVEPDADLAPALLDALRAVRAPERAEEWAARCREWAGRFGWDATAGHLLAALTAERQRLSHQVPQRRTVTDACAVVRLSAAALARADLCALRATDLVDHRGPHAALLLVGADEQDAEAVIARIAPTAAARGAVDIRLARHGDALGWRHHPPVRPARRPSPAVPDHAGGRLAHWAAALAGVFALALGLRLAFIQRSYDLFVDEITYVTVGRDLATGDGLTLYGHPFNLHPPAFFGLLAAVIKAVGGHGDTLRLALALRPVDAVAGALTAVAVTALLRRTVRPAIALAAGLLLACDPFLNRFDSRLMLEAPATAAAALGVLVLARTPATRRARLGTAVLAGLLFALSITTKELYALVTLLPLAVLAFSARGPVRRLRLTAVATTLAGYGVYVAATAATGGWSAWWTQKTAGLARAVGTRQITGFNRPTVAAPAGLGHRLLANLGQFGVPYALIAAGGCATVWLLLRRTRRPWLFTGRPARSVVTAWAAGALFFLLYAIGFGTLEEQMFYPLVVTSTAALALAVDLALPAARSAATAASLRGAARRSETTAPPAGLRRAVAVLTALALAVDAWTWAVVHTRHDDAYLRTLAWTRTHIPPGSTVDATEGSAQFLMPGVRLGGWDTLGALQRGHADYLLLSTQLVAQGYTPLDLALTRQLDRRARLLHTESGATNGQLRVYDVRALTGGSGGKGGRR